MCVPVLRDVKIEVWEYIKTILMGLGAVLKEQLAHPYCALSLSYDELTHSRQRLDSTHLSIYLRAQVPVSCVIQNTQYRISLPLSRVCGMSGKRDWHQII